MKCPYCGNDLKQLPKQEFKEIEDWFELPENEMEKYLDKRNSYYNYGLRYEYECISKCPLSGTVLYHHHPFRGIDSKPGESWSLTWIK